MPVFKLTNDNYAKVLEENSLVLIDFWAAWCTTCTSFSSVYEEMAEVYPDLLFAKVDTQIEQEISAHYRIQSIPTILVFHNGQEIYRKPGAMASHMLEEVIQEIQSELKPLSLSSDNKDG